MQYDQSQLVQIMSEYNTGQCFACERLTGGANNSLWRAHAPGEQQVVIKDYGLDGGDRLYREWAFLNVLAHNNLLNVPIPIWKDDSRRLACFSYLVGAKLQPKDISECHVSQAAKMIRKLCEVPSDELPNAKGAHLCLTDHLDEIELRISKLEQIAREVLSFPELSTFTVKHLRPEWEKRRQAVLETENADFFSSAFTFASPSDFGFHNILCDDNVLKFIDFEYAGIDDLATLLADFALTPETPISERQNSRFREIVTSDINLDKYFFKRLAVLDFLFPIKWACIILNVFLPEKRGRILSASTSAMKQRQSEKLTLAIQYFDSRKDMELAV